MNKVRGHSTEYFIRYSKISENFSTLPSIGTPSFLSISERYYSHNSFSAFLETKKYKTVSSSYAFHTRDVFPMRRLPVTTVNCAVLRDKSRISRNVAISAFLSKNFMVDAMFIYSVAKRPFPKPPFRNCKYRYISINCKDSS